MSFFKKYYYGQVLKHYDASNKDTILKGVYLKEYNTYSQKDFLELKKIYNINSLFVYLKDVKNLKNNPNKLSVPFLETLFYSKFDLELLPYDLKIENAINSIKEKIEQNFTIKEFVILNKNEDTMNCNLLFMLSYNKRKKLYCDLIYQDANIDAVNDFKILLDLINNSDLSYFKKDYKDINLYQEPVFKILLNKHRKDFSNYFVNKFTYDFDSGYHRQILSSHFDKDKHSLHDDEFNFEEFDEYFDSEFDESFNNDYISKKDDKDWCYEILGLTSYATTDDIKRAYRNKTRQYHPDINKSADAERKFKEVNAAYRILIGKDINNAS